jgi:cytidine deaminase
VNTSSRIKAGPKKVGGRDLVFGLTVPIGADREPVLFALRDHLSRFRYRYQPVKLSDLIPLYVNESSGEFAGLAALAPKKGSFRRRDLLIKAGNDIREALDTNDAVALIGVDRIKYLREQHDPTAAPTIATSTGFVLDSLKHPTEIQTLRAIYGPSFVALGIYAPPLTRRNKLIADAADCGENATIDDVEKLMRRDEDEQHEHGQRVRRAFELSDAIVDVTRKGDVSQRIGRVLDLLFGHPYLTPTRDEYGIFLARAGQVRSGQLGRQVGAAILRDDNSVIAVGMNDVAKPGGGQYTEVDDAVYVNGRDGMRERDTSDVYRERAHTDILQRLSSTAALAPDLRRYNAQQLFDLLYLGENPGPPLARPRSAPLTAERLATVRAILSESFASDTIDYMRAVHAEMACLTDAARNGSAVRDGTLYSTTFPCHDCAKHIVASGLREVIYLEAYPKSLAQDLYGDSIEINTLEPSERRRVHFHSFVGVAPSRYLEFFAIGKKIRKDRRGHTIPFEAATATLQLPGNAPETYSIFIAETLAVRIIN